MGSSSKAQEGVNLRGGNSGKGGVGTGGLLGFALVGMQLSKFLCFFTDLLDPAGNYAREGMGEGMWGFLDLRWR